MKTENTKYKDSASRAQKCACTNSAEAQPVLERKFKDSGIPWIGEIPEDWEVCRLKNLHTDSNVGESIDKTFCSDNPNDILFYTAGLKPIHTTYLDFPKWKYTHKSNLLLSRNGTPYVYIPKENAVYSDHIIRIDIDNRFSKEFVRYCLQQAIASVVVDSVSIATWSISLWDKQNIPLPPLPTQQRIADFLDKKCAEIDELSALQETMIAELKRYKQSVITEAVTGKWRVENGKLKDESGKMKVENGKLKVENGKFKDSGVEWIGEIPEGWRNMQLKRYVQVNNGKEILFEVNKNDELAKPVYGSGGVFKYTNDILYNGESVLFGRKGTLGKPLYVNGEFWVVDTMYYLTFLKGLSAKFCYYLLTAFDWEPYVTHTAIPSIVASDIISCVFPIPPLSEQQAIADYLDEKCSEIDELIAIKQQKIEQLKEYKKSVIFEYVTGKREVER